MPMLWFFGIGYFLSTSQTRRRAALACSISFVVFMAFAYITFWVLPLSLNDWSVIVDIVLVYLAVSFLVFLTYIIVTLRKGRQERLMRADKIEQLRLDYLKHAHPRIYTVVHNPNGFEKGQRLSFIDMNV